MASIFCLGLNVVRYITPRNPCLHKHLRMSWFIEIDYGIRMIDGLVQSPDIIVHRRWRNVLSPRQNGRTFAIDIPVNIACENCPISIQIAWHLSQVSNQK